MSVERTRRHVDAVARELISPLLERRAARGWTLAGWDAEQGISLTMTRGARVVLVELERRDESADCYTRTARFNVCARGQFDGAALGDDDRQMLDELVRVVRERELRLPELARPLTSRRSAVREIVVDQVLVSEGRDHYYVNPYVGCMIGCEFCYVAKRADFSRELEGLPAMAWGAWVDVKINAPEVLAREVTQNPPGLVRLSPIVTDPYQPLEKTYRITRRCLEVLLPAGFAPVILTRGARVVEDVPLLARFERAAVGFSIPTDDDAVRRAIEPGADPIEERIAALERCRAAGLRTFAVIQPILPMNVEHLIDRVAPWVDAVRIDRLHFRDRARELFRRSGLDYALDDAFFDQTEARLREGFRSHGVRIDDLDDMAALVNP
ncbi:MAG: radical SAM protein [Sorangiineae bacterium]|nr:radical SAM protein [Polyangiaceae bacterium]MEB2325174.1 radical SAM protein [Sorangiineae bacterium]